MQWIVKKFDELSSHELYELLKARVDVFVVEQKCPYPEIDGLDYESLHIFCQENGKVLAYLRAFTKERGTVQMGRVLTVQRGNGLGAKLLKYGIDEVKRRLHPEKIYIEAQVYAVGYYEKAGFQISSDEFLEDGIPHVQMILEL